MPASTSVRWISCSLRLPRPTARATTSGAWWWPSWTSSASSIRSPVTPDAASRLRCTDRGPCLDRQRELLLRGLSGLLETGNPDSEEPDRLGCREAPQQVQGDRPHPLCRAHRLGERPRTGVGREVGEPDL